MDDEDGLFNITLSISDDSADETPSKPRRTDQTEDAFQAIKREYKPKVENGDIAKTVQLPLGPHTLKPHIQDIIHAVEELYYFRKYDDAVELLADVLEFRSNLDSDTRQLLTLYAGRCQEKRRSAA